MTRDAIPWTPEDAPADYNPYLNHNRLAVPFGGTAHLIPSGGRGGPAGQQPQQPPPQPPQMQHHQQQMAQYYQMQQPPPGQQPRPLPPGPYPGAVQPPAEERAIKGSVLDKRRKQQGGAGLSASAGYAKKMAEMAAAQANSQRMAQQAMEDDGVQDPLTGEFSARAAGVQRGLQPEPHSAREHPGV